MNRNHSQEAPEGFKCSSHRTADRAGSDESTQPTESRRLTEEFHALHERPGALVLVNAWDAGSARVIEQAGAAAVGTSSAGMAWSLGYADGERVPPGEFIAACARIRRAVALPISIDIERGFGRSAQEVAAFAGRLLDLGVAGVNIEDGLVPGSVQVAPPDSLCERIAAIRNLAAQMNARIFINARTDTYLATTPDRVARYEDTVSRARLYGEAGANGIFVPGMDLQDVPSFARAISLPLNLYAGGGWAPPVIGLRRAGVRRISMGCGPMQSTLALLRRIAHEAFKDGTYNAMSERMLGSDEVNELFRMPLHNQH